ncbi:MAG: HIT family protein [Marinifilaceae bacterium]|jgi:histidine triad (HIT) family protein|nr:HIT family protein [Marinifilaceae bacterium]
MATIFTKIINKEIPCYLLAETEDFISFLDINPLAKGHALVIPKEEVDYIFDLPDQMLADLNIFAKKIAKAIEKSVECKRIGQAVIGLEVPHTHIHLVPINEVGDLSFSNPKIKLEKEEFEEIASRIKTEYEKLT